MVLTVGSGPFGEAASGEFNFDRPDGTVIYWEDWPKRFRIELGGKTIADSRAVKALHETGHLMRLYIAREDVDMRALGRSGTSTHCPHKGDATYYSFGADDGAVKDVAWSYEDPLDRAPPMKDYLSFDLDKVDAWYMEDDEGYAHPRNPYHRVDVHQSSRHVAARLDGVVVAETQKPAILFETGLPPRYYFASDEVQKDQLQRSETLTHCPYKGPARHWHVATGSERVEDAAWSLSDPIGDSASIEDWISFYPDKVAIEVDGEVLRDGQ